jgi:uncharacterized membrane protein YgcG
MRTSARGALCLLALLPAAAAAQRQLTIERFAAELVVLRNGSTIVTERITARFDGQWNGLFRSIPINYDAPHGANYRLRLDLESATDAAGTALRVEENTENGTRTFKIWVPNARDATHTIVLRYRVPNALRFFEEHDELYWNVTGTQWEVPIKAASASIMLPTDVSGTRATAFTGAYGSRSQEAQVNVTGNSVQIVTNGGLAFREGLTVVVGWNPGVIARPSLVDRASSTLFSNLVLGFPVLVLLIMARFWYVHGRDPRKLPITTAYEPPEELRPAEMGTLLDNTPDVRDITATLVDLAVRGYLTIEEQTDEKLFGLFSTRNYVFHLKRDASQWHELRAHERALLNGIFQHGSTSVEDKQLKNRFYRDIPGIQNGIFAQLVEHGHYKRRPDHVRGRWIAGGVLSALVIGFLGVAVNARSGIDSPMPIAAAALSGLIIIAFGIFMPARTVQGARTLEQVLGFEEFLRRVESDRFERVIKTPELFEKYLPFAMALRVDDNWCRAFQDICTTPPQWYSTTHPHGFSLHSFGGSLNRMAVATGAAMTAAPRSSSGSSGFSSGGGFSGGGFGGGGGGGF